MVLYSQTNKFLRQCNSKYAWFSSLHQSEQAGLGKPVVCAGGHLADPISPGGRRQPSGQLWSEPRGRRRQCPQCGHLSRALQHGQFWRLLRPATGPRASYYLLAWTVHTSDFVSFLLEMEAGESGERQIGNMGGMERSRHPQTYTYTSQKKNIAIYTIEKLKLLWYRRFTSLEFFCTTLHVAENDAGDKSFIGKAEEFIILAWVDLIDEIILKLYTIVKILKHHLGSCEQSTPLNSC